MAKINDEQKAALDNIKALAAKNPGKTLFEYTKEYLQDDGNMHGITQKFGGNINAFYLAMADTCTSPADADAFKALAVRRFFVNDVAGFLERMRRKDDKAHYSCNVFMQRKSQKDMTPVPVKFKQGTLSYIGARTGRGKTTAMLSIAMDALHQGKRVYFYTNEETTDQITMRAIRAQYFADNIDDRGNITAVNDDDWTNAVRSHTQGAPGAIHHAIDAVAKMLQDKKFTIIDGLAQRSFADIPASLEILQAGDVVLLDYIQHIRKPTTQEMGGGAADYKAMQYASQTIADIAAVRDLIVIAGAQLNRNATQDDKGTAIDDNQAPDKLGEQYFRESGDLEQDADTIIQIGKQEIADGAPKRFYKIIKHRGCPQDSTVYAIKDDAAFSLYACDIDPLNHMQRFIAAEYKATRAKATSNGGKAQARNHYGDDDGNGYDINDIL